MAGQNSRCRAKFRAFGDKSRENEGSSTMKAGRE
ncbi:hypothetical protein X760_14575 [Mesorhizobium sp. LSHC422A00]|nr:hypothetical protein X760_14575 [Mesorhizobium sp. LSHC422A00]ESX84699.1 hypothetical protein X756_24860 [Mesorhizobium sp. LSHC412B00]ESX95738.1 hypothetical protein X755_22560 [Mesorhizobium sp. LNJC405B00]ESY08692.1 hypothetical protein X753_05215 [Mesorhizobium sp. LNJC399B00]ESY34121.1 hypothetical protein X748_21190 [Mesorhizobium sp. LNJC386A00]ESZ59029.1 hypothetical protein X729_19210 [Mesorhizobium sp. L103C131B0]ESZ73218.1 hypothetical protein X726_26580 [Mesorhizobium sp. L103C